MREQISWFDYREPPKILLEFAASADSDENYVAANSLGRYAHEKSIETLMELIKIDGHHIRSGAIRSVSKILQLKEFAHCKQEVGRQIAEYLFSSDKTNAINAMDLFVADPVVLEKFISAICLECENVPQGKRDLEVFCFWFNMMLETLFVLDGDDRNYAINKLIQRGFIGPSANSVTFYYILEALVRHNPQSGFYFASLHLKNPENGGYELSQYGNNRVCFNKRDLIRCKTIEVIRDYIIKINQANNPFSSKEIIDILILLSKIVKIRFKKNDINFNQNAAKEVAFDTIYRIYGSNPSFFYWLKICRNDVFKQLPQSIKIDLTERIEMLHPDLTQNSIPSRASCPSSK